MARVWSQTRAIAVSARGRAALGGRAHTRRPGAFCSARAMMRAAIATTVTLIATVRTRLGARPARLGVRRDRPITQITALNASTGAPISGLVLVIPAPIAANAI